MQVKEAKQHQGAINKEALGLFSQVNNPSELVKNILENESDRIYRINRIFFAFPEERQKGESFFEVNFC